MTTSDRREFLAQSVGALGGFALIPDSLELRGRFVPSRTLHLAVIGVGAWGREILTELARFDNVSVDAICDTDSRRRRRALRLTGDAKDFENWEQMLQEMKEVTGVVVATPTHLHKDITLAALAAKKDVYLEAPMASSLEDAEAIVRAGRASKSVLAVGHLGRSNPVYKLARSFYRSNSIETLVGMRAWAHRKHSMRVIVSDPERSKAMNWKLDESVSLGLLGEMSSHQLDTLAWFTGQHPRSVVAQGHTRLHDDGRRVPDTVNAQFTYKNRVQLAVDATLANSFDGTHEILCGTMGTIKLAQRFGWLFKEADAPIQGWEVYANRQQFHDERGITLIADATKLASQGKLEDGVGLPNTPLHYGLEAWMKSLDGKTPVACSADDAYGTTVATLAACTALKTGTPVDMEEASFEVPR